MIISQRPPRIPASTALVPKRAFNQAGMLYPHNSSIQQGRYRQLNRKLSAIDSEANLPQSRSCPISSLCKSPKRFWDYSWGTPELVPRQPVITHSPAGRAILELDSAKPTLGNMDTCMDSINNHSGGAWRAHLSIGRDAMVSTDPGPPDINCLVGRVT